MKHFSDEELYVLSQSAESSREGHLRECPECLARYQEFVALLESAAARAAGTPGPAPGLEDRVWMAIHPSLPVYGAGREAPRTSGRFHLWRPRRLAWTGAFAALVVVGTAFWAGRLFERRHAASNLALEAPAQPGRVVLLVVREHLDRSERLLVELDHAGRFARAESGPLAREASDLLEDNRLYRQTAVASKDPALAEVLDRLDRVLVEVAHEPAALQGSDLARMREQMNLDGLLFELRVVRDRQNKTEKDSRL
ncbi:MAG TPA: hypothetical protein VMB03_00880 [Bryobacteraceae bacterium]|nr:hypothetical protein [Bryobacteraceae bacterium]